MILEGKYRLNLGSLASTVQLDTLFFPFAVIRRFSYMNTFIDQSPLKEKSVQISIENRSQISVFKVFVSVAYHFTKGDSNIGNIEMNILLTNKF